MISGIGTDLIEIHRVVKACQREAFLSKYFTLNEIDLIKNNDVKAAGNFAVKEAVAKMFGTGFREISPIEIEVLRDELGKPYINLSGNALLFANRQNIIKVHVSISNTKDYATAFVVGET